MNEFLQGISPNGWCALVVQTLTFLCVLTCVHGRGLWGVKKRISKEVAQAVEKALEKHDALYELEQSSIRIRMAARGFRMDSNTRLAELEQLIRRLTLRCDYIRDVLADEVVTKRQLLAEIEKKQRYLSKAIKQRDNYRKQRDRIQEKCRGI